MTGRTTIEWTAMPGYVGAVWNPTTGCTRVSAGCDNCYAFALHDRRFAINLEASRAAAADRLNLIARLTKPETIIARARTLGVTLPWPRQYDLPFSRVQLLPERLDAPLRTRRPTCYFVDSMSDLFHEDVPDDYIDRVRSTMFDAPQHRFLILTKRPERMRSWVTAYRAGHLLGDNVWLGTSVEDQASADERIPHLLATPAAVRFLSCEPLLGPVGLRGGHDYLTGLSDYDPRAIARIDWVIAGGESGPRARPMDLAWARSLRDQCAAAGVAFFMKQLGERWARTEGAGPGWGDLHGRDPELWPEDLRVREWPR